MPAALSDEIRIRINKKRAAGATCVQVAKELEVSKTSASRIPRHTERTGSVSPLKNHGRPPPALAPETVEWLVSIASRDPEWHTLDRLLERPGSRRARSPTGPRSGAT